MNPRLARLVTAMTLAGTTISSAASSAGAAATADRDHRRRRRPSRSRRRRRPRPPPAAGHHRSLGAGHVDRAGLHLCAGRADGVDGAGRALGADDDGRRIGRRRRRSRRRLPGRRRRRVISEAELRDMENTLDEIDALLSQVEADLSKD
ncbi:MAG: hypothetical protein R2695_06275 [Acidimicrobiales bacterium]